MPDLRVPALLALLTLKIALAAVAGLSPTLLRAARQRRAERVES